MRDYGEIRGTMNSMIEIVDDFGGNFAAVERSAVEVEEAKAQADSLYLSGDYEGALEAYAQVISMANSRVEEARVIARRALFYVYMIEWSVVTGTLMLSGVGLYTLMVRRKMYAPVTTTRLDGRLE
jgi:hypothetical protein